MGSKKVCISSGFCSVTMCNIILRHTASSQRDREGKLLMGGILSSGDTICLFCCFFLFI